MKQSSHILLNRVVSSWPALLVVYGILVVIAFLTYPAYSQFLPKYAQGLSNDNSGRILFSVFAPFLAVTIPLVLLSMLFYLLSPFSLFSPRVRFHIRSRPVWINAIALTFYVIAYPIAFGFTQVFFFNVRREESLVSITEPYFFIALVVYAVSERVYESQKLNKPTLSTENT